MHACVCVDVMACEEQRCEKSICDSYVFDHCVTCNLTWAACSGCWPQGIHTPSALRLQAVSKLNHKFLIHLCVSGGHVHQNDGSALFMVWFKLLGLANVAILGAFCRCRGFNLIWEGLHRVNPLYQLPSTIKACIYAQLKLSYSYCYKLSLCPSLHEIMNTWMLKD